MKRILATAAVATVMSAPAYAVPISVGEITFFVSGAFTAGTVDTFEILANPFTLPGSDDFSDTTAINAIPFTFSDSVGPENTGVTFQILDDGVLYDVEVTSTVMTDGAYGTFTSSMIGVIDGAGAGGGDVLVDIIFASTSSSFGSLTLNAIQPIPLPATLPLFLAGIAGIGALVRRKA